MGGWGRAPASPTTALCSPLTASAAAPGPGGTDRPAPRAEKRPQEPPPTRPAMLRLNTGSWKGGIQGSPGTRGCLTGGFSPAKCSKAPANSGSPFPLLPRAAPLALSLYLPPAEAPHLAARCNIRTCRRHPRLAEPQRAAPRVLEHWLGSAHR